MLEVARASESFNIGAPRRKHLFPPPSSLSLRASMDSPVVTRLFRRLFAHETCSTLRTQRLALGRQQWLQRRGYRDHAHSREGGQGTWQQRTAFFPEDKTDEYRQYPAVTADQLRVWKKRPRRVKMLMRDFIEGIYVLSIHDTQHADADQKCR